MTAIPLPGRRRLAQSGEPTTAVWREQALTEIAQVELALTWLTSDALPAAERLDAATANAIAKRLAAARDAAIGSGSKLRRRFAAGASVERTWGQIDAAGEALLRAAPPDYVIGQIPRIRRRVQRALTADDTRRTEVEKVAALFEADSLPELNGMQREVLLTGVHAANCEARRKQGRVRSFRNLLLGCSAVLAIAAVGLAGLGLARPELALLCFQPSGQVVCPTGVSAMNPQAPVTGQPTVGQNAQQIDAQDKLARKTASPGDVLLIEVIGLMAAALAAATALRRAHGTSNPYGVQFAGAVLKLPSGALTAALGLLLIRADFVPGLSALDTPAQIIGWAIILGYSQQLFTRFVDERAQSVLTTASKDAPAKASGNSAAPA